MKCIAAWLSGGLAGAFICVALASASPNRTVVHVFKPVAPATTSITRHAW
jgi:hypothetical protein